jgi:MerR family transcriptional regulator, copper efflux regulator
MPHEQGCFPPCRWQTPLCAMEVFVAEGLPYSPLLTRYLPTGFTLVAGETKMGPLRSKQLAERSGVNLQTIRYYQEIGLLPEPPRSAAGYRRFPPDAVRRIRFIKRAQELGFALAEVKELLALQVQTGAICADVRRRANAKIANIEAKIRDLRWMKNALERLAASCSGAGPVGNCPILDYFDDKES